MIARFATINSKLLHEALEELVAKNATNLDFKEFGHLLENDEVRRIVFYFLDYGAATSSILQNRLGVNDSKVYRCLKKLNGLGIIESTVKAPRERGSVGGARPTVWKVPDAQIDQVNEAIQLHRHLLSPKYVMAEEMGQLILEEYLSPRRREKITSSEIQVLLKERGVKPHAVRDLVHLVMVYLKTEGIRASWS